MRSIFVLFAISMLASCAENDSTEVPSQLTGWTQESVDYDFVSSLSISGEREAFIGRIDQGVFVYFYDSNTDCSDSNIFDDSLYDGAMVKVFYPLSGNTFAKPTSVTFRSPNSGPASEVSPYYQGELEIKGVDNLEVLSGWVKIEESGFDEDSNIVGSFNSAKCY